MSPFWEELPRAGVVQLRDAKVASLLGLPAPAPAVVLWPSGQTLQVGAIIDLLDRTVTQLFPGWLPGAESIEGRSSLAVSAVRSLATRQAARTSHYGPFLSDLAERSLRGQASAVAFPDAVRALGLARLVAECAGRREVAIVVDVLPGLEPSKQDQLVSVCERAADLGGFGVWLVGAEIRVARVRHVSVGGLNVAQPAVDMITFPPSAGHPHPGSSVERTLEKALRTRPWAAGRQWNQTHRFHTLANPVRLDLLWADERLNVEIDGPEHHDPAHYAADRRRDNDLQLAGYAVLRFTNSEIEHDVGAVVARIERFIIGRRRPA